VRLEDQPLQAAARTTGHLPNFEGELLLKDGERRDVMISSAPLPDPDGAVRGSIAAIVDLTERKQAETRQQVLLYELQHRVKNIIATISALATRTLRGDMPAAQYAEAFQGRLRGMAGTHELLSRSNWAGADLRALVETALRSHASLDGDTLAIKGPDLLIAPAAASTLGMVFYELATNAAKYGGLAGPGGRVEVSWSNGCGDSFQQGGDAVDGDHGQAVARRREDRLRRDLRAAQHRVRAAGRRRDGTPAKGCALAT